MGEHFFYPHGPILRHDSYLGCNIHVHVPTLDYNGARAAPKKISGLLAGVDAVVSQLGRGGAAPAFRCGRSKIILCADLYVYVLLAYWEKRERGLTCIL